MANCLAYELRLLKAVNLGAVLVTLLPQQDQPDCVMPQEQDVGKNQQRQKIVASGL